MNMRAEVNVWQTSRVTTSRIIIGRRVGTLGLSALAPGQP
jgi:hypothetical protein